MGVTEMNTDKMIDVLGTPYRLVISNADKDEKLNDMDGYRDNTSRQCVVDDYSEKIGDYHRKFDLEKQMKKNIRHELTHAFLYESGLAENSDWAMREEMVDWVAMQGLKLYKARKEAGAVDE